LLFYFTFVEVRQSQSHASRNRRRLKAHRERNKLFAALAVLACSGILSRNYLLLTGRSRKRSPSLASITPFSSSLPSFLGASLLSLSLSLSIFFSFPLALTEHAYCTHQRNYSSCTQQLLSSRPIFASTGIKKSASGKTENRRIKGKKKKILEIYYFVV